MTAPLPYLDPTALAAAVTATLGAGHVASVPNPPLAQLQLSADANWEETVTAVRAVLGVDLLRASPVGLWQNGREARVGPNGVLCWTDLVPDNETLDARVHRHSGDLEIVLSWIAGPTAQQVSMLNPGQCGLAVRLIREEFEQLITDFVDASIAYTGGVNGPVTHPLLDRASSLRDGGAVYHRLVHIAGGLARRVIRRDGYQAWEALLDTALDWTHEDAPWHVADDAQAVAEGAVFLPLRDSDAKQHYAALMAVLAALSHSESAQEVRRACRALRD